MSTAAERLAAFTAAIELDEVPRTSSPPQSSMSSTFWVAVLRRMRSARPATTATAAVEVASHGPATAIGLEQGLRRTGAFVNGTLCHALDYDDTHAASVVHVSASAVGGPRDRRAARLLGEGHARCNRCGQRGLDQARRSLGRLFHARGFHPTGVCGVFGATAAGTLARARRPHDDRCARHRRKHGLRTARIPRRRVRHQTPPSRLGGAGG